MATNQMSTAEAVLDFRVPAKPHLARVVREGVAEFATARGVGGEDLGHFMIALGEALANAIEHGGADRPIEVEVRIDAERIVATITDGGAGFSADLPPEPKLPDLAAERGRGLPIMRRCSDIFAIKSEAGQGTAVVVGRYLKRSRHAAVGTSVLGLA
jgi:anti-sigma regulatory factor (Ser/Thr protein kinase)